MKLMTPAVFALGMAALTFTARADSIGESKALASATLVPRKKNTARNKTDKETSTKNREEEDSESSKAVRVRKKVGVDLLYSPLSGFFLEAGARASYNLNADTQFGVFALGGRKDLRSVLPKTEGITFNEGSVSAALVAGYLRYFFGNSFSVKSGVGFRTASISISASGAMGTYADAKLSMSGLVAPVALGNHWSWSSGFTLGCDWIAAMIPFTSASSSTYSSNSLNDVAVTNTRITLDALAAKLAKETSITLGLLSAGFSF